MNRLKTICILYVIVFMCQLCACSSERVKESEGYNKFLREIVDSNVESDISTGDWIAACTSEKYILRTIKRGLKEDGSDGIIDFNWYECDFKTGKRKLLKYDSLDLVSCINYLPNGNVVVINMEKNISIYNSEQNLVCEKAFEELYFTDTDEKSNTIIENVRYVFGDGEFIYILGVNEQLEGILYVLDENLNGKHAIITKNDWNMTVKNGDTIIFYDTNKIYSYNAKGNSLDRKSSKPSNVIDKNTEIELLKGTSSYDYLYLTKNHIDETTGEKKDYLIGVNGEKHEKIMDFVSMGIQDLNILEVCGDGADGYWFVCENQLGENQNIHFIPNNSVQDYSNKNSKICCKVGMSVLPEDILPEIDQFNFMSDTYYLEIVDYSHMYEDINIANAHLFMDVLNGKIDAVFLDDQLAVKLIRNGALYDLTEYINNSPNFSKENLITHYLDSVSTESGEIYALYPSFEVAGFICDDYIDFSSLDKYNDFLEKGKRFIVSFDGNDLLYDIVRYSGYRYIDEKTGKLRDNSLELCNVMEFLKQQIDCCGKSYSDQYTQLSNGEAKAAFVKIPDPYYYKYFELLIDSPLYVSNLSTEKLLISKRKGLMGISAKSGKKEGIMAFWEFLFAPEFYHKEYTASCYKLPIFKSEYDTWKKRMLATESYVDEQGVQFAIIDATYGFGEIQRTIERGSMSKEEVETILKAIQEADYIKPMDEAYVNIITEEAASYFNGQQNLKKTYDNVKARLDIAAEEKK